jgi:hypothetical protein
MKRFFIALTLLTFGHSNYTNAETLPNLKFSQMTPISIFRDSQINQFQFYTKPPVYTKPPISYIKPKPEPKPFILPPEPVKPGNNVKPPVYTKPPVSDTKPNPGTKPFILPPEPVKPGNNVKPPVYTKPFICNVKLGNHIKPLVYTKPFICSTKPKDDTKPPIYTKPPISYTEPDPDTKPFILPPEPTKPGNDVIKPPVFFKKYLSRGRSRMMVQKLISKPPAERLESPKKITRSIRRKTRRHNSMKNFPPSLLRTLQ